MNVVAFVKVYRMQRPLFLLFLMLTMLTGNGLILVRQSGQPCAATHRFGDCSWTAKLLSRRA